MILDHYSHNPFPFHCIINTPNVWGFETQETEKMEFGYARVSTEDQRLDLQIDALTKAGIHPDNIFQEKISGVRAKRPQWDLCRRMLRKGDTLVIWRLDRMSRSLIELATISKEFEAEGIQLRSLTENIDTVTAGGKLIFNIFAAVAQFERDIISERTKAGLAAARKANKTKRGGRKPVVTPAKLRGAKAMLADGKLTVLEVADTIGVSKSALYRALKEERDQAAREQHDHLQRIGRLPKREKP